MSQFVVYAAESPTYYSAYGSNAAYATARSTSSNVSGGAFIGQTYLAGYAVYRSFIRFDTSGLPDNAVITGAQLQLSVNTDTSVTDFDIEIVKMDWQSPINSYREVNYDGALAGTVDAVWRNTAGIATNTPYLSPPLDISRINRTGWTYYALRSNRDGLGITPTGDESIKLNNHTAALNLRPQLLISYYTAVSTYATYPVIKMYINNSWQEFNQTSITDARVVQELIPISTEIPISTATFTIYSANPDFSIFSTGGFFASLSKRAPVLVYENYDGTNHFIGKFYLDKWKKVRVNTYEFTAIDAVGVLDATTYDGQFWDVVTRHTVADVLGSILNPLNITYTLDAVIGAEYIGGWIPPGTCREAIQQVCFRAGLMVSTAKSETLNFIRTRNMTSEETPGFYKLPEIVLTDNDKNNGDTLELLPLITSIELLSHDYSRGTESETIFEDTLLPGSYKIIFQKPFYEVTATGVGFVPTYIMTEDNVYGIGCEQAVGGDDEFLVIPGSFEFGSNSVYLNVYPPGGSVLITGYPWVDSVRAYLFNETGLDANVAQNNLKIENASMVNQSDAPDVLARVREYYRQRYQQRSLTFSPASYEGKIGLSAYVTNPENVYVRGLIEKAEYRLTGGFVADTEIVGIEKTAFPTIYQDSKVVYLDTGRITGLGQSITIT